MKSRRVGLGLLIGLLIVSAGLNLLGGPKWFALNTLFQSSTHLSTQVLWQMRVPRTLCALMVGALLAVSGQLLQTVSHNPIADPSILGINSGATLALIIGGVSGISLTVGHSVVLGLIGAVVAFAVVMLLSVSHNGIDPLRLLLGGTVFSGFISCISYAVSLVTNTTQAFRNLLIGGFSGVEYAQATLLAVVFVIVFGLAFCFRSGFTVMALDQQTSRGLGVAQGHLWIVATLLIVCATGASVAVAGNIGFVGLGIPQLINTIWPGSFKQNLGFTMIGGAIFMALADLVAKTVIPGTELPLAALSAIIGGCFLFAIVAFGERVIRE